MDVPFIRIGYPPSSAGRAALLSALLFVASLVSAIPAAFAAGTETLLTSDKDWAEAKDWHVYWNAEWQGCFAERSQSDGTVLLLGQYHRENYLLLGFTNDRLGFVKLDQIYPIEYRFDRKAPWNSEMKGFERNGAPLLLNGFRDDRFHRTLAASSKLTFLQGGNVLATVSLKGSGAALKSVEACRTAMMQESPESQVAGEEAQRALLEAGELENQAIALFNAGKFVEAEPLMRRVLEIREGVRGSDHLDVSASLTNLGSLLRSKGDLAGAEPVLRRALAIREARLGPDDPTVARTLTDVAILLELKHDAAGAEPLFRRALAIREKLLKQDDPDLAASLDNLALLLYNKGDLVGAEPLYRRALSIWEKALKPTDPYLAFHIDTLATLLELRGDLPGAEALFRRSLAITEGALGPDHPDIAASANNLARLLMTKGDVAGAESLFRRSLAILEKGPANANVALALNNLANLIETKGDLAGAEPLYRRSIAIAETALGPDHQTVAVSLDNLAILLGSRGDLAGAEPLFRRALAIREKALGPEHRELAKSLDNLATLLDQKGDMAGAEPLHRRALAIYEKTLGTDNPDFAKSLTIMARSLYSNGDLAGAEKLYRRGLAILEKLVGSNHPDVATSLNNLAMVLRYKGDLTGAKSFFGKALSIYESTLGPQHPYVAANLNNLGAVLREEGDLSESLDLFRRAARIGVADRSDFLAALFAAGAGQPAMMAESFEVVQQTASSEAGAALRSLSLRFSAGGGELAALIRSEQDLTQELSKLERDILTEVSKEPAARNKGKEDTIRARTAAVTGELESIREKIARDFPDYAELSRPAAVGLPEAQKLLADDEALIVIDSAGRGESRDYVWAVTRDSVVWKQIDSGTGKLASDMSGLRSVASGISRNSALSDDVSRFRAMLAVPDADAEPAGPDLALELYRKLLGPVEGTIKGKAHLIFVLNGAVSSLPPQMLVTQPSVGDDFRSRAWLIRDHAITIMPTVSSLKLLRGETQSAKAPKPFRGYGDPVFDPEKEGEIRAADLGYRSFFRGEVTDIAALKAGLPRLPGTGRELRAVARNLGVPDSEIVLREAASEAAVKAAKLDDYDIVYFATHGLVAGEVERVGKGAAEPALALTIPNEASERDDGLLTASEVAQLKLNADWVVLSACNTAAGGKPGAGALSGLARAFFYAGARSVLVSHWVVDDEATAELMSRTFASAAAHPGRRQAEALRDAMLSIINDTAHPEWAAPRYWAPFVLVGEAR